MTPEQEYEEAERLLTTFLWSRLGGDPIQSLGIIAALLRLTWPSGQPMIGVISQDQEIPPLVHGQMPSIRSLIEDGYRRVLLPEEKR